MYGHELTKAYFQIIEIWIIEVLMHLMYWYLEIWIFQYADIKVDNNMDLHNKAISD